MKERINGITHLYRIADDFENVFFFSFTNHTNPFFYSLLHVQLTFPSNARTSTSKLGRIKCAINLKRIMVDLHNLSIFVPTFTDPKYSNWKLENFNFTRFSRHRSTCFCQPRIKQCALPLLS